MEYILLEKIREKRRQKKIMGFRLHSCLFSCYLTDTIDKNTSKSIYIFSVLNVVHISRFLEKMTKIGSPRFLETYIAYKYIMIILFFTYQLLFYVPAFPMNIFVDVHDDNHTYIVKII